MDIFELNKIAGAFLGTLLFAIWLNVISGAIFTPGKLVEPGYPLPSAPEASAGANGAPRRPSRRSDSAWRKRT